MSPVDWTRLRRTFDEVVDLEADERSARLAALAQSEGDLARLLQSLLDAHDSSDESLGGLSFLRPAGERLDPQDPLGIVGSQRAHFRVTQLLGRGGMGVVYLAEDLRLQRPVALKFLNPHSQVDPAAKQRFLLEARAVAALEHPNVCTVYEVGETDDGLFIAMPRYSGETLKTRLARDRALSVTDAIDITTQVARGLAAAQERGVVHRDLKPGNLMLCVDGVVRILDFGLVQMPGMTLAGSGAGMGTLRYMSPEHLSGGPVDGRSDLWSLGVVLVEMLTGARPSSGTGVTDALKNAIRDRVDDEPTRERITNIVSKLLRLDPSERYASAKDLLDALGPLAGASGGRIASASSWRRVAAARSTWIGIAVLLVIGVAYPFAQRAIRRQSTFDVRSVAAPTTAARYSLAVLPLRNHSASADQDFFAAGMTDELTTTLAKIEGLRVIAHQSVRQFRNSDRPIREIARTLGVRHIVDGSVMIDGSRVRIIASLIDVDRDAPLWTERFERDHRDVMTLEHDLAVAIANGIQVTLSGQDSARLERTRPVDPIAFDEYLRGTQSRYNGYLWNDFGDAAQRFEHAIAKDPSYAPAYAGLALVRVMSGDTSGARTLASRAVSLDSLSADAQLAIGMVREVLDWDWTGAEAAFREAIRHNPGHAEAYHELGMLLMRLRRFDEALSATQRSLYVSPVSARYANGIMQVLLLVGRDDEALQMSKLAQALALGTQSGMVGLMLLAEYRWPYREALKTLDSLAAHGLDTRFARAYVRAKNGSNTEALRLLDTMKAEWRLGKNPKDIQAMDIATLLMALGQQQDALDWLERAIVPGTFVIYLGVWPAFEPLHGDARFRALTQQIGLPY